MTRSPIPRPKPRPGAIQGDSMFKPCPECKDCVVFVNGIRGPYLWCPTCDWRKELKP
jgi:hypothetical protein